MSQSDWFSRRHKTAESHLSAQSAKEAKVARGVATMIRNIADRAIRSNREQVAVLDARLGRGVGARKERARLAKRKGGRG